MALSAPPRPSPPGREFRWRITHFRLIRGAVAAAVSGFDARRESAVINDAVREDIRHSVLCWLATVDENGQPNVSPKELFTDHGEDAILIADIASPVSVRNLARNPLVCVSFVDVFRQRGFKIAGRTRLIAPVDPDFAVYGARLQELAGPDFQVRHAIHVAVTRISRIWAPSYALFPDRTVEDQQARAHAAYGVRPASSA
ncbi:MAG: pyridoxamine 5'-phosphate oxidase family protein [Salinarimonadaceae bacterium]|nr:MAG: pyridoxamine 5'-phosphate oxidase family protein [Salinarimonadaceae bacterium]